MVNHGNMGQNFFLRTNDSVPAQLIFFFYIFKDMSIMLSVHDNGICILDSWVEEKKGRRRGMGCVLKKKKRICHLHSLPGSLWLGSKGMVVPTAKQSAKCQLYSWHFLCS